jgi:hypothetical protein
MSPSCCAMSILAIVGFSAPSVAGDVPANLVGNWTTSQSGGYGGAGWLNDTLREFRADGTYSHAIHMRTGSCTANASNGTFHVRGNQISYTPKEQFKSDDCRSFRRVELTAQPHQQTWEFNGAGNLTLNGVVYLRKR